MALSRYTVRQLEAFSAVAELLSYTAASSRLGLTPSAVSQLVAELETAVGFKLFDRSTRKVALSAAGQQFIGAAETALRHMQLAHSAAADLRNRSAGIVRVAAPLVIAAAILPLALKAYAAQRPKVVVRIRDTAVERLVETVASGDVDLAVGPDRACGDAVARSSLFQSPWVLWCAPKHPLARRRTVHWNDLRDHPLVAAGRDHERSVAQMRSGLPDDERISPVDVVDNVSTALGIAAAGLAVTLSPAYVGTLATPLGLVMRRVVDPEVMREVCLYQPTQRAIVPAAQSFGEFLSTWLTDWNATNSGSPRRSAARRS